MQKDDSNVSKGGGVLKLGVFAINVLLVFSFLARHNTKRK
jgi:hypothetical protein